MREDDFIGNKFNKWTVLDYSHTTKGRKKMYLCKCECGVEKVLDKQNVKRGLSKSCGCSKYENKDLTGKKFGKLKVLKLTGERKHGNRMWECLCDCGNISIVSSSRLNLGKSKSCGCFSFLDLTGETFGRLKVGKSLGVKEYGKQFFSCQCICGKTKEVYGARLVNGNVKSCGCLKKDAAVENIKKSHKVNKGVEHYNFNKNITNEERTAMRYEIGREDRRKWRKAIYERDDYSCVICNKRGGKINAHHLNGFNWDTDGRYDVENGVTLCNSHHLEFHSAYGYGDNTKEQFEDFKKILVLN